MSNTQFYNVGRKTDLCGHPFEQLFLDISPPFSAQLVHPTVLYVN